MASKKKAGPRPPLARLIRGRFNNQCSRKIIQNHCHPPVLLVVNRNQKLISHLAHRSEIIKAKTIKMNFALMIFFFIHCIKFVIRVYRGYRGTTYNKTINLLSISEEHVEARDKSNFIWDPNLNVLWNNNLYLAESLEPSFRWRRGISCFVLHHYFLSPHHYWLTYLPT